MSEQPVIDIQGVSYAYRSNWTNKRLPALNSIHLQVYPGECFGFLGHNGAGKTTTIKCILDLIRVNSGRIRLFGKPSTLAAARQRIGFLPEQPYFYDHLTAEELLRMSAALAGIPAAERNGAIEQALARVRMSEWKKYPMRSLSKGLTQKIGMAQAIVHNPRLLILDEPFSGLDPIGRKQFRDLLFELKGEGVTIFISSHILGDIEFLCDRASIMARGEIRKVFALSELPDLLSASYELVVTNFADIDSRLRELGTAVELQGQYMRVLFTEQAEADQALASVIGSPANVVSFQRKHGTLEELFVRLVRQEVA